MAREAELIRLAYTRADLDAPFRRLVSQAAELFEAPYAALTFLDRDYTHARASIGFKAGSVPRDLSFCRHVIETDGVATHEGFDTSAVWEGRNSSPAERDGDADEPEEAENT